MTLADPFCFGNGFDCVRSPFPWEKECTLLYAIDGGDSAAMDNRQLFCVKLYKISLGNSTFKLVKNDCVTLLIFRISSGDPLNSTVPSESQRALEALLIRG